MLHTANLSTSWTNPHNNDNAQVIYQLYHNNSCLPRFEVLEDY